MCTFNLHVHFGKSAGSINYKLPTQDKSWLSSLIISISVCNSSFNNPHVVCQVYYPEKIYISDLISP